MLDIIYWLFSKIGDVVQVALNFHIIGNLSLLHFIIAFFLLSLVLSFLTFGHFNLGTFTGFGSIFNERFSNIENKRAKQDYYNYTFTHKMIDSNKHRVDDDTWVRVYEVNGKTGDSKLISKSRNKTIIDKGDLK